MTSTRIVVVVQLQAVVTDARALTGGPDPTDERVAAAVGVRVHAPSLRPDLPGVTWTGSSAAVDVRR